MSPARSPSPDWRGKAALALLLALFVGTATLHAARAQTGGSMQITSPAFAQQGRIPALHTCEGEDLSPPLQWTGVPDGARSLVLIVDDPDAPDPKAPKTTWVHWVVFNLPANSAGLPQAVRELPAGSGEGKNDWKRTGYGGPCPPIGRHRYFHKLYALDTQLSFGSAPRKSEVESAMRGHVLAEAVLVGTYQKGD